MSDTGMDMTDQPTLWTAEDEEFWQEHCEEMEFRDQHIVPLSEMEIGEPI